LRKSHQYHPTVPKPARRRGRRIGLILTSAAVLTALALTVGHVVTRGGGRTPTTSLAAAVAPTTPPTGGNWATTTTTPSLAQPPGVLLPPVPNGRVRSGSRSPEVAAYEQRLRDLRFDPGPVDGTFDEKTRFAVETLEKLLGRQRDGTIDQPLVDALVVFQYSQPLEAEGERDRVEIDLDRQVLTVYRDRQVALITTTSTGNGKRFCGGGEGCQYAVTPTGRYEFQWHVNGWRDGDLGRLYNPWYFNGGIAVHGFESVPTRPASHGCARIPMHIARYFGMLVEKGMAVYVVAGAVEPPRPSPPAPAAPAMPATPATPATPAVAPTP
jgi:peptidoglycan hydrolase-like protein with peptidoglycan-binding domain